MGKLQEHQNNLDDKKQRAAFQQVVMGKWTLGKPKLESTVPSRCFPDAMTNFDYTSYCLETIGFSKFDHQKK